MKCANRLERGVSWQIVRMILKDFYMRIILTIIGGQQLKMRLTMS